MAEARTFANQVLALLREIRDELHRLRILREQTPTGGP
jgi:hypothetical protein